MADWEDHMQWSHAGIYTDEYFHKVIEALCSKGCRKKRGQKKGGGGVEVGFQTSSISVSFKKATHI